MMDMDNLMEEMNDVLSEMRKEDIETERYATCAKRLSELQQLAIKDKELDLKKFEAKEKLALERREMDIKAEDIRQKEKASKRQAVTEFGKTCLSIVGTGGLVALIEFIEHNDIIRTKGWSLVTKMLKF